MLQKSYHTKTSDLISQFVQERTESGFSAMELLAFLSERGESVNKTTVYRNLDKLVESGRLIKRKSAVSDGFIYLTAEKDGQCYGHIHFQCEKCGAMIHLSDRLTTDYLKSVSENFGFKVDFSLSSLNGLCEKCRTFE